VSVAPLAGGWDAPGWHELAVAGGNPFATPVWLRAWWEHVAAGGEVRLLGVHAQDGRLAAVLPLYVAAHRPVRVVRFLGHGVSDELGPVCASGDRPLALEALGRLPFEWDAFIGDDLPAAAVPGGARRLGRRASPVLALDVPDWETFLQRRSRDWRKAARRGERRLGDGGEFSYRVTKDPARLQDDLTTLFALHRARWRGRSSAFARRESFHRAVAPALLERGWLRLRFIEHRGRPVAALYNLRLGDSEFSYQGGRDPAYDRFGVGMTLRRRAIREALESGLREYRLLRGDEAYKRRLATHDPGVETVVVARGARGKMAEGVLTASRSLPRRWRRRLPAGLAWESVE
jgi:CelD/BcsL family acetyltransferase involved in cellulose biosynthesis